MKKMRETFPEVTNVSLVGFSMAPELDNAEKLSKFANENGYTSKEKLAIMGRSNGGLLVGAVMTQKPDIAQVALPGVGVLDMLRYHKFTAGAGMKNATYPYKIK